MDTVRDTVPTAARQCAYAACWVSCYGKFAPDATVIWFTMRARQVFRSACPRRACSRRYGMNRGSAKRAYLLDLETMSVVRHAHSLEQADPLQRRPHATDRRVRTLWLTPAGEAVVAQVRQIPRQYGRRRWRICPWPIATSFSTRSDAIHEPAATSQISSPHPPGKCPHAVPRLAKAERISAGQGCGRPWIQQRTADRRDEQRPYNNE
jgi:DNA-binding MarR family transcriptional regulator